MQVSASAVETVSGELQLAPGSVAVSPVVTVEPRVRRFHQPVSITLPLPLPAPALRRTTSTTTTAASSLRLLCSMSGLRSTAALPAGS